MQHSVAHQQIKLFVEFEHWIAESRQTNKEAGTYDQRVRPPARQ